ncbi:hypothetical protein ACSBR2_024312 [Camellia fascicularis]
MDVPSDHIPYLKKAFDGLKTRLAGFLQASALDWIIYDFAPYWLPPIATKLSISRTFFLIINTWHIAFFSSASALIDGSDDTLMEMDIGEQSHAESRRSHRVGLGLELSGLPFFWALRKLPGLNKSELVELPDGFEERTRSRGVVWKSWAPQLKILGHESVEGFLTHYGWCSMIEGLQFGKPLIMLPFMVDQGLNARVLHKKKVRIEIPRDEEDGSFTRNLVADSIRLVMVDNNEGLIYRKKTREMSALFGDEVLHDQYMHNFVEYLSKNSRCIHEG